jgi:cadmium resistance protein CadD (predicted permease)
VVDLLVVIGVATVLFVATNVDDIFVLVTFFADPAYRPRHVVIGQFLGMGALIAVSMLGSLLALVVPGQYIGLLGVLPFALGVVKLVEMRRGGDDDEPGQVRSGSRWLAVALVTFANGGDNIGAYVPVFATRTPVELVITIAVFLVLTAACCFLGHALVTHPRAGPTVRRIAVPLTPFVLMALGVLIVIESGAYRLVMG